MEKIELGSKVKCIVTGFEGIITERAEYLNGCVQYKVTPKMKKDGTVQESYYIDEEQLKVTGKGVSKTKKVTENGGPTRGAASFKRR